METGCRQPADAHPPTPAALASAAALRPAAGGARALGALVFRGWGGPAALDLLTDGRSAKLAELQAQPAAELCWLLPRARCQFRLRGQVQILPGAEHPHHWQALTPGSRALWGWPEPGAPLREADAFPTELPAEIQIPPCFVLLHITLQQVELLELGRHPHRRSRWCAADGWSEARLNP